MHEVYISRDVKHLGHHNAAALIKKAVKRALDAEGIAVPCLISVMLTDDEGIRETNRVLASNSMKSWRRNIPMNLLICQSHVWKMARCGTGKE